ncbi:hypothetical protein Ndes2437A_g04549 [Nannochloris sp. 'desiccata']|nr:hypothetical protein KSW81_004346 [Chlorella desiccata (nom. nud.)]
MNRVDTAGELRVGDKRPAAPTEDDPLPRHQSTLPPRKKKTKLDSAAQSLLTEVFGLQDILSENEIEALARKVKSTRTQVLNFFNGWKQSVNVLVDKSKSKTPGFHTEVVQYTLPSHPPVTKVETIPTSRIDSERLALHLVSSATTIRHNAAATLAPYLDPQGGVKDLQSAVNISAFSQLTASLGDPTFTGQLQLCDALLATTDTAAFLFLCNNANVATALQTIVSRGMKGKQITLVVRALHAMVYLGGFKKEFIHFKTLQLLRNLVTGTVHPRGPYGGGGETHPAVKKAATKLLALYPEEMMMAVQAEEDTLNKANEVAQQQQEVLQPPQQQQRQQVEEEEVPESVEAEEEVPESVEAEEEELPESVEPPSEAVVERKEEKELTAALINEEKEAPAVEKPTVDTEQVFNIAAAVAAATEGKAEEIADLVQECGLLPQVSDDNHGNGELAGEPASISNLKEKADAEQLFR